MDTRKPKTVKVTVYSSRNLKPKKGDGDPLAWVVFGFGKEKCCTQQIRDRNAKWNEESTFTITDQKIPLKLNIKDKEDMLGQLVIPLKDLPSDEHFLKWVPLGPHKRNTNPSGELCIDCWIDDYYDDDSLVVPNASSPNPMRYINKHLSRLTGRSPEPDRKDGFRNSYSSGITSMKGSISVEDLSHSNSKRLNGRPKSMIQNSSSLLAPASYTNLRKTNSSLVLNEPAARPSSIDIASLASLPTIKEQCYPPKVLNIVPNSGPTAGGTLIQISGKNLGLSKEDITRLMVAGCNCLSTLQYYTSNKIMCTTSESSGIGPISISTKSGGISSSKMMFEFVQAKKEEPPKENKDIDSVDSQKKKIEKDREKDELIEKLRGEVDKLKNDNHQLREYIDKLLCYLMEKYPDALDSSKMYR